MIDADDEVSPVDSSRAIHNSILSAGGTKVKYTEYPGLGHVAGIEMAREETGLLEWLLTQNRSTGTIKRTGMRNNPIIPDDLFGYNKGYLRFSSLLPSETIITLFDLNGQIIFKTGTRRKLVKLPANAMGRIVLWNVSNSQFSVSGKATLCQN